MILYPFNIDIKSILISACSISPLTRILRHSLLIKHTEKKCRSDRSGFLLMMSKFDAKSARCCEEGSARFSKVRGFEHNITG
jgi:hypothetical protein